jgi:hypothetical protein
MMLSLLRERVAAKQRKFPRCPYRQKRAVLVVLDRDGDDLAQE